MHHIQQGGGLWSDAPTKKLQNIAGKIAVFDEGNCCWNRKFSVSLTMEWEKGTKKYKPKQCQNPAENTISHICGQFHKF
jgi:hypothetical protein